MESKKLKAKDLINVGIYTAIYLVIFFVDVYKRQALNTPTAALTKSRPPFLMPKE